MLDHQESLQTKITALFMRELHIEVPSADTDLVATGRLDSLGLVELMFKLEQQFGIRVQMEDLEFDHFRSVSSIAAFVSERLADASAAD